MIETQNLNLRSHALSCDVGAFPVKSGQALRGMLLEGSGGKPLTPGLRVRVNGHVVPEAYWDRLRPRPGARIDVVPDTLHGGGDTWKQVLGAIVLVVVSYFTAGTAASWGAGLAGAIGGSAAVWNVAIMAIATLAVTALTAPPMPSNPGGTDGRWNQLTGSQNALNLDGVIPIVLGESRYFPPHAARPYGQVIGSNSYQHCMFDLGYGDLDVSEIRIGDTPIGDFAEAQWEITTGDSLLYQNDIAELAVNATLENGVNVTRSSAPNLDAVGIEIVFPQGLFWINDRNRSFEYEARFTVVWRPVGSSSWQQVPANARRGGCRKVGTQEVVRVLNKKPFGIGISWDVPAGSQIEIAVTRTPIAGEDTRNTYVQTATYTILRSIRHTNPSRTGTNKLYVRIKANDQLTGTLSTVSCMVKQKVPVYNRGTGTWSAPQATTNTAWVAWWLLTACPAVKKRAPLTRMHLDSFADYAEWCEAKGLQTRMVLDASTTLGELLKRVLSGSLGSPGVRDGRYAVVFDHGDTQESWTFTPMEITEFTESRPFLQVPHALRVKFVNPLAEWQQDEIIVVDDGYSYRGLDARGNPSTAPEPDIFETLTVEMAMLPQQAWQLARFHLAQAKFRPAVYGWLADHIGLSVARGDVVEVAHDAVEWGAGWGRVENIVAGGPDDALFTVTLDTRIETKPGQLYGLQLRTALGGKELVYAVPHSVATDTFYVPRTGTQQIPSQLDTQFSASMGRVQYGDAAVLGLRGQETVKLLVTGIQARQDLSFAFSAVAYDPRVAPFWAGAPSNIVSEVSGRDFGIPAPPVITGIVSSPANDETDNAGIPVPTVGIGFNRRDGYLDVPYLMQAA